MLKDSIIGAGIVMVIVSVVIGVQIGKHQGFTLGYTVGEDRGSTLQLAHDKVAIKPVFDENTKLIQEYNQLSDNYNTLRSNVIKYISATQYQISKPITCNTDTTFVSLGDISTTCR